MAVYERSLQPSLEEALGDTPVVMVVGPRQAGKTTLVKAMANKRPGTSYVTLDDLLPLEAACTDPVGFVAGLGRAVAIDEIQKAPDLLPAIKASVDRDRRPGRFLLTGSANVLTLPRVAESLAGRMEVATLWPLSQGELAGHRETFVDRLLAGEPPGRGQEAKDVVERLARGGYPEAIARPRPERRRAFFDAYLASLLTRDVRDIANIEDPGALRRLLQLAAVRSGGLLNHSELARTLGLPVSTLKRYLTLLEALFLVRLVPAWATNRGKRLVRAPKFHLVDTGLLLALAGLSSAALERERTFLGPVLESFVAGELTKQLGWSQVKPVLHHFRSHAGHEVDLVLEDPRGHIVGIEVKASATVNASDLNGLRTLVELAGRSWVQGVVLHLGTGSVAFGPGLTACPIDTLWA